MNSREPRANYVLRCLPILLAAPVSALALTPITFATVPLYLAQPTKPNVMVIFDNSQSMDATMSGKIINGDQPNTRGNIARGVLRSILTTYRSNYNWGLTSFATTGTGLYTTYPYYLGDSTTMLYTNDCVGGVSASNSGLRCIANPEPGNGFGFITYDVSGDDANINDVFYAGTDYGSQLYGNGVTLPGVSRSYNIFKNHSSASATWASFSNALGTFTFTPTDAGWLPNANVLTRQLFVKTGKGYYGDITGVGTINEGITADSTAHYNNLMSLLADETLTLASGEIKNSAVFTPLAGSLQTVKNNFTGSPSPITNICQKNFVVLATDGNPTGRTDGTQYAPSDWAASYDSVSATYSYGQAYQDVFAQVTALRNVTKAGNTYDVQTFVIGMGDTVANPGSVAALNEMARRGGGRPTAFFGSDPTALTTAFQSIVGNIQSKLAASSSVATNGGKVETESALYQARYSSEDWTGNLVAYPVTKSGALTGVPIWESGVQLQSQNWNTGRQIVTYKPSAALGARGIPFRWPVAPAAPTVNELDASQVAYLNMNGSGTVDSRGAPRLAWLRGDGSNECAAAPAPCASPKFRRRATPLGDLVNSSPIYVGAPNFGYYDDMEAVRYSSFVATNRDRTPMVYVGGNDGMLHGFNTDTGAEVFAYVPSTQYATLSKLGEPTYAHAFYVDGDPTYGDAFYGGAWHSMLASGMRSGGKGVFALDITDPAGFTEANAASVVRWEFQDADMGYVFGQPMIAKTNNGKWSVIVGGGYNVGNANGHAYLFVIDAQTGALIKKIDTAAGTAGSPNGLSAAGGVDSNGDGVVDFVYAGDLNGNLWKFDLSAGSVAAWGMGNANLPLFTTPTGQSITAAPDLSKFPGGGYIISFGTGRYIATGDLTDTTTQALYGIRDSNAGAKALLADLQEQRVDGVETAPDGKQYQVISHAVGPAKDGPVTGDNAISRADYLSTKKGWYMNLGISGQRVASVPQFRGGRLIVTTIIPDISSPCAYGGSSVLVELDAITGNRPEVVTFDTNGDNMINADDMVTHNGVKVIVSGAFGKGILSAPTVVSTSNGTTPLEDKYFNSSEGSVVRVRETAGSGGQARVMWREIN